MSFGIDVNILLYASDTASPKQQRAEAFLDACAERGEVFCLAWLTVMSYLRMATHPKIFSAPLSAADALLNMQALMALPHCRVISEEQGFWQHYLQTTVDVPVRGDLVPDAHLAALLRQHGVRTLYSHDRDFRKFTFLNVRDPLA